MDVKELKRRLDMLLKGDVISQCASKVTETAFRHLLDELKADKIEQAEMLFTHLPTALTRMDKEEDLEGPSEEIMKEVKASSYFTKAVKQIDMIEKEWGKALPSEERDFLAMHYTNVIQLNKGGKA
ncbi:PRD domain-containing protein [Virgibacillus sp. YIM 98842]|uniref:PRD domain-containing protein n=1 Tax=Virgibacillus sp. YIM 98842 TaxID=2663533 RepID=UPI0013DB6080|nr:PRD domain-containing protein [Virgibacillus sp. YIM 98842]